MTAGGHADPARTVPGAEPPTWEPGTREAAEHLVTRPEVRRFACAISAMEPYHHNVAAARALGYPDLLAPSYFFAVLGLAIGRELPRSGLGPDGSPLNDELAGRRIISLGRLKSPGMAGSSPRPDHHQAAVA